MRIGPLELRFREAVKPAPEPPPGVEERLSAVEDAVTRVADEFESVLDRINRWSARQAAQKRSQALKQLDSMPDQGSGEIVVPEGNAEPVHPDQLTTLERARIKADIRRRAMGG